MVHNELPQAWWFDSHNIAKPSPWLGTTLSELDEKTKQMLKLIDQDADSFSQRAEMYYKKRPVLVDMLGDLYRSHRSLAKQHDLLKLNSTGARRKKFAPSSCTQSFYSPTATMEDKGAAGRFSSCSTSVCSDFCYSESDVDDPEEHDQQAAPEPETNAEELMRAEIKRLKDQNEELHKVIQEKAAALREELAAKDDEKREVIRQLASCIDMVKEENQTLRECIRSSKKKQHPPSTLSSGFRKLAKDLFSAKIFGARCQPSGPIGSSLSFAAADEGVTSSITREAACMHSPR